MSSMHRPSEQLANIETQNATFSLLVAYSLKPSRSTKGEKFKTFQDIDRKGMFKKEKVNPIYPK